MTTSSAELENESDPVAEENESMALKTIFMGFTPPYAPKAILTAVVAMAAIFIYITLKSYSNVVYDDQQEFPSFVLIPRRYNSASDKGSRLSPTSTAVTSPPPVIPTLRDFLLDERGFVLAMAPSFFGFYGYLGAVAAWEEHIFNQPSDNKPVTLHDRLRGVCGASAGAMVSVMLSLKGNITARRAAEFCTKITVPHFADFPGFLSLFRGNRFEQLMNEFLLQGINANDRNSSHLSSSQNPFGSLDFERDTRIPVAVTGFDLQTMSTQIINRGGNMARAARASATFPFLLQPVPWRYPTLADSMPADVKVEGKGKQAAESSLPRDYVFIDGGVTDVSGIEGLQGVFRDLDNRQQHSLTGGRDIPDKRHVQGHTGTPGYRVVNMVVGNFVLNPPGPTNIPGSSEVLSISVQNLPQVGPWAMSKGKVAVEAAYETVLAAMDIPLFVTSRQPNHYELHLDASEFWKASPKRR
jgi:Patatin-like phospholipase